MIYLNILRIFVVQTLKIYKMYKKTTYKKAVVKKVTTHICSECINDFDAKELFVAQVPDRDYSTIYCEKCLKKLEITIFKPYHKIPVKKTPVEKKVVEKKTAKKKVVEKKVVEKKPVKIKSTTKTIKIAK